MHLQIKNYATRLALLLSIAALTACASKVRLDDLPAVVDRSNAGTVYTTTSGAANSGIYSANTIGANNAGNMGNTGVGALGNATSTGVGNSNSSGILGAGNSAVTTVQAGGAGNNTSGNNAGDMAGLLAKRSVYFDYDSYDIRDEFRTALQAHARNLGTKRNVKVSLEGHTDERGGAEYNLALGQKRANAVQQALQALGVSGAQVEAVSYGKEKPKALGANEAGFAENRRVDIRY